MKPTLMILQGLPSSGKTEFAKDWVSKKRNRIRISWSDMKRNMCVKDGDRKGLLLCVDACRILLSKSLNKGIDVVLDEENLYGPSFAVFLNTAYMCGSKVEFHLQKRSVDECKKQCLQNGGGTADLMRIEMLATKYSEILK